MESNNGNDANNYQIFRLQKLSYKYEEIPSLLILELESFKRGLFFSKLMKMNFIFIECHSLLLVLVVFVIASFSSGTDTGTDPSRPQSHGALGQGFFIPELDLLSDELHAVGAKVFESVPSECKVTNNVGRTQKDESFYSNTESLYKAVSTNSKIEASLKGPYTLGASLASVTNNIIAGNTEISGLSLDLKANSKDHSLKKDCINRQPLDKELLKDFEGLEREIKKPWLSTSWNKYKVFLKKHGSHVVKKVESGSSIHQYVFAKSKEHFSQRDFTVKACLSLGGLTKLGKIGVSACSGISKEEANNASSTSMVKKLVVRGGTDKTRAELTNERDKTSIANFLQEGVTNPSPIAYNFVPVWTILKTRFIGTPSMAKVLNLEQFYKGYLHFGCSYEETSNYKVLQKFALSKDSDPDAPTYKCMLGPTGCHVNNDCHYKHAFWCACAGESCIRHKDVKLNSGTIKKEAYAYTSESPGWGRQGCKLVLFECRCRYPRSNWKESWSGDSDGGLRDVHYMLAMKKSKYFANERKCDDKGKKANIQ